MPQSTNKMTQYYLRTVTVVPILTSKPQNILQYLLLHYVGMRISKEQATVAFDAD